MSFKVLHRGYQHIRLSSSFSLTLDIQDYLRSLARDEKGIESIQFYMDQQHFTLRIKEGFSVLDNACLLYTSPSPRDLSTSRMPSSA